MSTLVVLKKKVLGRMHRFPSGRVGFDDIETDLLEEFSSEKELIEALAKKYYAKAEDIEIELC